MKKTLLTTLAALAVSFGAASTGSAAIIGTTGTGTVNWLAGYGPVGGHGAEYTWTITSAPSSFLEKFCYITGPEGTSMLRPRITDYNFQTFCLERREDAGAGDFEVNSVALGGGVNAPATGDPVSVGTSWLYYRFARGLLAGYDYTPGAGRLATATELQHAIWSLEGDRPIPAPGTNQFYDLAVAKFAGNERADAVAGENGVFVLNVTSTDPLTGQVTPKQDFLVHLCVPEGGSTLIVLGLSLCGLSLFRSRVARKTVA